MTQSREFSNDERGKNCKIDGRGARRLCSLQQKGAAFLNTYSIVGRSAGDGGKSMCQRSDAVAMLDNGCNRWLSARQNLKTTASGAINDRRKEAGCHLIGDFARSRIVRRAGGRKSEPAGFRSRPNHSKRSFAVEKSHFGGHTLPKHAKSTANFRGAPGTPIRCRPKNSEDSSRILAGYLYETRVPGQASVRCVRNMVCSKAIGR